MSQNLSDEAKALILSMAAGGVVACVEVRGQKIETMRWSKNDQPQEMQYLQIACEFLGTGQQVICEWFPDKGQKCELLPIPRGEHCIVELRAMQTERGSVKARVRSVRPLPTGALPGPPARPGQSAAKSA